jgi:hypothetical protein
MAALSEVGKSLIKMEELFRHIEGPICWLTKHNGGIVSIELYQKQTGITLATYNLFNGDFWIRADKLEPAKLEEIKKDGLRFEKIQT